MNITANARGGQRHRQLSERLRRPDRRVQDVESQINITSNTYSFVGADIGSSTITGDSSSTQVNGSGAVDQRDGGNVQIAATSYQNTSRHQGDSSSGGLGDGSHARLQDER